MTILLEFAFFSLVIQSKRDSAPRRISLVEECGNYYVIASEREAIQTFKSFAIWIASSLHSSQ